jgi:N-acetylglucosamine-6-phosphate deacetylase
VNGLPHGAIAIRGGCDLTGDRRDVHIVDGVVVVAGSSWRGPVLDVAGCTVAPGFVDLQVNGAVGADLTASPGRLWDVAAAMPRFGVTSFLPTIITSPPATVDDALQVLAGGPPGGWLGARPIGLHLEGPMIASARAGAHEAGHIVAPSSEVISGWSRDAGVAMATLAPELPGALPVIDELVTRGVVVAAGHTDADGDAACAAVQRGLSAVTHLFNAMAPMHHRTSSLAAAALTDLPVAASLIADGIHVEPRMLRLAWRALGADRRILVSDGTAPLGAPAGRYVLAGRDIVSDGRSCRTASGALAGGLTGIDACLRNIIAMTGCGPAEAVTAVTETPARLLGRPDLGVLRPGAAGDVAVLDANLDVVATIVAGVVVYRRAHR